MSASMFNSIKNVCATTLRQTRQLGSFGRKDASKTYKAAVIKKDAKELLLESKQREKLESNQVRIQVRYCSVNSIDVPSFHSAHNAESLIPGYELAGEVIELGSNVKKEQIMQGERVAALSLEKLGAFAEECVLSIDDVFRLPSNVELKNAAVLTSGHALALWTFTRFQKLTPEDTILVTAGRAGLGLAAVDVAHNVFGAKVIGVVDSDQRAELLRERGAFKTIQFDKKLHKQVMAATKNKGVDIVYDAVGNEMFSDIGKCVNFEGKIFHAAPCMRDFIPNPRVNTYVMMLSLLELRKHNLELYRNIISDTLGLADQGIIDAYVSAKFDFTDINKAVNYIEEKKATGKILIEIR